MDVGVIGVGTMGRNHVRVYSEMKSVDSVGVYDPNTAGAREMGEKTGPLCTPRSRLLAHVKPSVYACLPRSTGTR